MRAIIIILVFTLVSGITKIALTEKSSYNREEINFYKKIQGTDLKKLPVCPFCNLYQDVIRIDRDTNRMVHMQFKNKRAAKKYFKENQKKGYVTDWEEIWPDLLNEYEFLVKIDIKGEQEKFSDTSYHWFCKKCKKIF